MYECSHYSAKMENIHFLHQRINNFAKQDNIKIFKPVNIGKREE